MNPIFTKLLRHEFFGFSFFLALICSAFVLISPNRGLSEEDDAFESFLEDLNRITKSGTELIQEFADQLNDQQQKPEPNNTPEESGYLSFFAPLHQVARDSAFQIVSGEPDDRKKALDDLKVAHGQWHETLSTTLPPMSMTEGGNNLREELLKLLEIGKSADVPEKLTDQSVKYLRTRADFNSSLRYRPKSSAKPEAKSVTKFVFRPGGNPFVVYGGNGKKLQGNFKVSFAIPTALGSIVVWQEPEDTALKYLVVEYNGMRRFFRLDGQFDFSVEDPKIYSVSGRSEGKYLILTIQSKE